MPIRIPDNLPAARILEEENIFYMPEHRAFHQDIRPLRILVLNLMPTKVVTETQLLRLLGNTPLQLEVDLLCTASYQPKNTPEEHLLAFYDTFGQVRDQRYDGLVITGAPVEQMPFEEVAYWDELKEVMEWSRDHVHSTLHICWAAQAGLYHHYGVPKHDLPAKLSGVYLHTRPAGHDPLFRGFDPEFYAPHSRYTEVRREDILAVPALSLLSESPEAGVYLVTAAGGRQVFITGHSEYDPGTLRQEYERDLARGLAPAIPKHYFPDDDPAREPIVRWRAHATLLFANWVNQVYQNTPYRLEDLEPVQTGPAGGGSTSSS